jgi:Tfp pilus assembly protein PilN
MININLLPKQHKEQIKNQRFNLYLTSIITLILFLIGLSILGLFFLKIALANRTKNLDRQIQEKQQELTKYDQEKNLIDNFNQTITITKELLGQETNWSDILNDLEAAVPDKLRLTSFGSGTTQNNNQTSSTKTAGQISIVGVAADQRAIVKLIEKLKTSKYFTNPELTSTERATASAEKTTAVYTFEISLNLNEKGNQ